MSNDLEPHDQPGTGFSRPTGSYSRDKSAAINWMLATLGGLSVTGCIYLFRVTSLHDTELATLRTSLAAAELARQQAEISRLEENRALARRLERIEDGINELTRFNRGLLHGSFDGRR